MVFTLAVAAADGCQYGCLYPSEGIVPRSGSLADGVAGIQSQQPVRLVTAVCGEEHLVKQASCFEIRHALQYGFIRE